MGTTDLFVELIVIGIGATAWVVLATFSIFGYEWAPLEQFGVTPFQWTHGGLGSWGMKLYSFIPVW